ncbi:MAG: hypothetical protein NZL91_03720 [Thermoflexales bacterium]|nr:hypothetical protein [Thermoflexales bacterium]MCX7939336.1 hypothetical protein [Thermoflexales bacterium]MDW8291757.1 hypothetical protein [Anaerolineae bacterium]
MNDPATAKLRELLLAEFTEAELVQLCKELGLNYEALPGIGTFGKTRALIEEARVQGKLRLLQRRVRDLRPLAYLQSGIPTEDSGLQNLPPPSQRSFPAASKRTTAVLILFIGAAVAVVSGLVLLQPSPSPLMMDSATQPGATPETIATSNPPLLAESPTPLIAALPTSLPSPTPYASPTPMPTPTSVPTATPELGLRDAHPAVRAVYEANERLREFFIGKEDYRALESQWSSSLVERLRKFANERLLRLMRLTPEQRTALNVQFKYVRPPTLVDEFASEAVVSTREYWEYTTSLNTAQICETRDYSYRLRKEGDGYRIYAYNSRLISSRCN